MQRSAVRTGRCGTWVSAHVPFFAPGCTVTAAPGGKEAGEKVAADLQAALLGQAHRSGLAACGL